MTVLVEANRRAHNALDDAMLAFLDLAVQGRRDEARAALVDLTARIERHMAVEETVAMPSFVKATDDGQTGPHHPSQTARQVQGDHKILTRTLGAVAHVLDSAPGPAAAARAQVVRHLEVFSRLKGVLEHHTSREQRDFYPVLDGFLDDGARNDLAAQLLASVDAGPPSDASEADCE